MALTSTGASNDLYLSESMRVWSGLPWIPVGISSIPGTGYLLQKFVFLIYPVMSKPFISYNIVTSRQLLINSDTLTIPFLVLD